MYRMRGHRISECLCFHQQSCSLDWWGDCGWGVRYKSAVLLCGWLLACYTRIPTMSLLPCLRTEFSQRRLTSAVKGTAERCFYSDHSASLVSNKGTIPFAHTCGCAHTQIYDPYQQCITFFSQTSSKSCISSTQMHTSTHPQPESSCCQ